jgi:septal ring factor EnvC (AmiA/AmiB activator)
MRAKPGTSRSLLLLASILVAALCVAAGASAETLRGELRDTQGKLDRVRDSQSALSATIADQNRAIDSMLGEVSALRQRQEAAEAELAAKQAELDEATARLEAEQRRLDRIRVKLRRALGALRERLVEIYLVGTPDALSVVLESDDWADVASRAEYLSRIQDYDSAVAERVEGLRDEAKAAVARMATIRAGLERARDEIAVKEREAEAASEEAAARFAELKAAQAERQEALDALQSREAALSDNLASISEQIADAGGTPPASAPAPLTPGQEAQYISESQASVPAAAPPAVKAAIEAANSIATTPYVWGGGHGSFESSGYDCSGAVSFALHGGGFLDSPLDSTGLTTWGEPGAGQWITVYGNSGHAWMIIAGLAFDTSGGAGPRWHPTPVSSTEGFIARHPAGY